MTKVFVEQPLASPGSANNEVEQKFRSVDLLLKPDTVKLKLKRNFYKTVLKFHYRFIKNGNEK